MLLWLDNVENNISILDDRIQFLSEIILRDQLRFESGRVTRAVSLAKTPEILKESVTKYSTTILGCSCMDYACRGIKCKHMIAVMLTTGLFL
jgi:hypothetical protein